MALPITQVLHHWAQAFSFFSMSANEFYTKVETAITAHEMPEVKVKRVNNKEKGILSASREYLRIQHGDLVFEICAAPFGKDFFISWWLYETEGPLRQVFSYTKFGEYLRKRAARQTFFQADKELMFRDCVHNVVMEMVDEYVEQHGLRGLSDFERSIPERQV